MTMAAPTTPERNSRIEWLLELLTAKVIEYGSQTIPVDTQMDPTSTNPVTNAAIVAFVNSSISTETAHYIGDFNSVADLEAYTGTVTNNDYATVIETDSVGNTIYKRYKYNGTTEQWLYEYSYNNSTFTAAQWAAINSLFTAEDKTTFTSLVQNAITTSNFGTTLSPYIAPAFSELSAYSEGDYVIHDNKLMKANTAVTAGPWDSAEWDQTTVMGEIKALDARLGGLTFVATTTEPVTPDADTIYFVEEGST